MGPPFKHPHHARIPSPGAPVGSRWRWRGSPSADRDPRTGSVYEVLAPAERDDFQRIRDVATGRELMQIVTVKGGYDPAEGV